MSEKSDNNAKEEARKELSDKFGGADFPVTSQMDLLPALDNGPTTKFEFGDRELTAMELASIGGSDMNFPYDNLDDFLDDAMEVMDENGYFDVET